MMSEGGYVKIRQGFMDCEWQGNSDMVSAYRHILLSAGDNDSNCCDKTIKGGGFYTSCEGLARELNLSVKSVKTALMRLKDAEEMKIKNVKRGILITLMQRNIYQMPKDCMEVLDNAQQDN